MTISNAVLNSALLNYLRAAKLSTSGFYNIIDDGKHQYFYAGRKIIIKTSSPEYMLGALRAMKVGLTLPAPRKLNPIRKRSKKGATGVPTKRLKKRRTVKNVKRRKTGAPPNPRITGRRIRLF